MRCIKSDLIQKYIDCEADLKEVNLIETHLEECEKCLEKVNKQRNLTKRIKQAVNLLSDYPVDKQRFIIPPERPVNSFLPGKSFFYSIAAACIIVFVLLFITKKLPFENEEVSVVYSIGPLIDANLPITKQQMIISIIDTDGNLTEYTIN